SIKPAHTAVGVVAATAAALLSLWAVQKLRLGKVDETTDLHGGHLVAEVLEAHGVKAIFTLVGGHVSPILVACEKRGIRVIDTRHEATTVFAADAVARLTGIPGVAIVTAGPGVTNTITAVKNAQMAETPLVLIGGAAATLLKGRGSLQDIDQLSLFRPICKEVYTVDRVRDIIPTMRRAFWKTREGVPGPVFVELPIDVLYPYKLVKEPVLPSGGGKTEQQSGKESGVVVSGPVTKKSAKKEGIGALIVRWYLTRYLNRVFGGAFVPQAVSPLPVSIPFASEWQIRKAVSILKQAKRPALVIGSQALLLREQVAILAETVERLSIPTFLGGMARGLLGPNSGCQLRHVRKKALREADVIVLAGAVPDFRLDYGRSLSRKAKIIAVNRGREALFKNSDLFWTPTLAVQADPCDFLIRVGRRIEREGHKFSDSFMMSLMKDENAKDEANRAKSKTPAGGNINPLASLYALNEYLKPSTILVADGGDYVGSAAYILKPRGYLQWLDPGAFGTLGVGAGFALGAKIACPEKDVVIIFGDGAFGYSLIELDTFARFGIGVAAVVGNDGCWSQIAREQVPMLGSNVACALSHAEYDIASKGLGGEGWTVNSLGQLDGIVKEALEVSRNQNKPAVVNVIIGKTDFREGSISV
ncbi:hypothetical protein HK102_010488, partial [Quaeritorhiza haematococci]